MGKVCSVEKTILKRLPLISVSVDVINSLLPADTEFRCHQSTLVLG